MACNKQFLEIDSIKTTVLSWPNLINETKPDEVIICIPGNPGLPGFYCKFLEQLYKKTNLPVWIVGHAGHDEPNPSGEEKYFNLNEQLSHKLDFIRRYTKPSTKIHILGHSIGAWMILEMLKVDDIQNRISTANLICPTFQHMALSPNGKFLVRNANYISILFPLVWILSKTPKFILTKLVEFYYRFGNRVSTPGNIESTVKLINPFISKNSFYMAMDEMDKVKDLDSDTLVKNKDRIHILYGPEDKWAPKAWFLKIKENLPSLYVKELQCDHAFVLYPIDDMSKIIADLIMKKND